MIFNYTDYAPEEPLYSDEELQDMADNAGEEIYELNKNENERI